MSIWIILTAITVCTFAIILVPLMKDKWKHSTNRQSYDIAVYKDQLREVERELERNIISSEEADNTRYEIQKRILAADSNGKDTARSPGKNSLVSVVVLVATIPLFGLLLYQELGSPYTPDFPLAERTDIDLAQQQAANNPPNMDEIIPRLQDHVAKNPIDIEGWAMLARSLMSEQRYQEAADAHNRIYGLSGDLQDKADYTEALLLSNEMVISPNILTMFQDIHQQLPLDPRARFYIGLWSLQNDNPMQALQDWIDLHYLSEDGAPWIPALEEQINKAATESGIDINTIMISTSAQKLTTKMAIDQPGPSAEEIEAAQQMSEEDQNEMIRGMVQKLADRLAENPDDLQGWTKLERAYSVLGETTKAANARLMIEKYSN